MWNCLIDQFYVHHIFLLMIIIDVFMRMANKLQQFIFHKDNVRLKTCFKFRCHNYDGICHHACLGIVYLWNNNVWPVWILFLLLYLSFEEFTYMNLCWLQWLLQAGRDGSTCRFSPTWCAVFEREGIQTRDQAS